MSFQAILMDLPDSKVGLVFGTGIRKGCLGAQSMGNDLDARGTRNVATSTTRAWSQKPARSLNRKQR